MFSGRVLLRNSGWSGIDGANLQADPELVTVLTLASQVLHHRALLDFSFLCFFSVLGIEPRASFLLGSLLGQQLWSLNKL